MDGIEQYYPIVAIAIGPLIIFVLFLMYIWYRDKYEKEPKAYVLLMFIWGAVSAVIALSVESTLGITGNNFLAMVVFVPIWEEALKGIGLLWFSKNPEYEGIMDGLVYGTAVGAGFALASDVFYGLSLLSTGLASAVAAVIARAIVEPVSHPFFSGYLGAEIGKINVKIPTKSGGHLELKIKGKEASLFLSFLTVVLMHSIWNYIAVTSLTDVFKASVYAILIILLFLCLLMVKIKDGIVFDTLVYEQKRSKPKPETGQPRAPPRRRSR